MKYAPILFMLALAAAPAQATPATPLTALLAKPVDKAEVRIKARVTENLGKNKYLVDDGGKRIEVKAGTHWYHTLNLETGKTYTFDGALHVKDKDGERKIELKLVRVWRADGARLDVRPDAKTELWKNVAKAAFDKNKTHASAPVVLGWHKS